MSKKESIRKYLPPNDQDLRIVNRNILDFSSKTRKKESFFLTYYLTKALHESELSNLSDELLPIFSHFVIHHDLPLKLIPFLLDVVHVDKDLTDRLLDCNQNYSDFKEVFANFFKKKPYHTLRDVIGEIYCNTPLADLEDYEINSINHYIELGILTKKDETYKLDPAFENFFAEEIEVVKRSFKTKEVVKN